MLSFIEEIMLLQLERGGGTLLDLGFPAAAAVLAGAAMMERALLGRIDTDLNRLFVEDDPQPTGDDILDDALFVLLNAARKSSVSPAIERLNLKISDAITATMAHASKYRESALQRLIEKGVLRREGEPPPSQYRIVDNGKQSEVRARLHQLILTDEIPDPRDVVLLWLIDACGLLTHVFTVDEIASRRERIEQLIRLDLIGQATAKAVPEIRFVLQYATAPNLL
jgi:hypothetical protein